MTFKGNKQITRILAIFLAISYGIGAPVVGYLEFSDHLLSRRFDLPAELIYIVCLIQLICAFGILNKKTKKWSAIILTITTFGAIVSHFKIGSPQTSIAAIIYSLLQIWFVLRINSTN